MIADTEDELHAFAARIGMKREWAQHPGTDRSHYDLVPRRRAMAVNAGAIEITDRQLVEIRSRQRVAATTTAFEPEKREANASTVIFVGRGVANFQSRPPPAV